MTTSGLPLVIVQTLTAVAGRERRVQVLRGTGEAVAVYVIGLGTVAVIDALAKPGHGWHLVLSLSAYGAAGTVLVLRALMPMLRRPRLVETAHAIEGRSEGHLDERLSSAVELAGRPAGGVSEWMIERTIALAAQTAAALDPQRLVAMAPARVAWIRGGILAVTLIGTCLVPGFSPYVLRAALPTLPRPSHVQLEVLPGDRTIALGSALDVQVRALPDPGAATLQVTWDDGVVETMACETSGKGAYALNLPAVTRAFSYRVLAGDGESRAYRIAVARPPELSKVALRITPPVYTGLPSRTVDGGDAEIIAGSTVALTAELTGETAASASVVFEGGEAAAALKDGILTAELKPTANMAYGLRLVGTGGLIAEPAQRWILAVIPDRAPTAKLIGDGLEAGLIGADEALLLTAVVGDDLGLRGVDLVVEVDGKERQRRSLPLMGSRKEAKLPAALELTHIGLDIGQQVSVSVRATDLGGQTTISQPITLAVASAVDARAAALAVRLRAVLKQIDGALEASRAITRTWNGLARGAGADRATREGDLTLMANRIALWNGDLAQAGNVLGREGSGPDVGNGRQLLNLGDELAAWTRGAAGLLSETCQAGRVERANGDDLMRGRDLAESLQGDLQAFRHDVALITARLEVGGVAGGAEAAIARLQRALPIARGERGWRGDSDRVKAGLLGVWFAGADFSGPERFREVGVPVWRNRDIPGMGRDNWCVRYIGEIHVPKDGECVFSAGADDGVRLVVAGKSMFDNQGWATHGYTEFRGKHTLKAGWHPLVLEMFQGSGESGLGLSFGANEGALRAVGPDDLRCRVDGDAQSLVRAMTSLPREQIAAADERLKQAMNQAAAIPGQILAAGDTAVSNDLVNIGRGLGDTAKRLSDDLAKLASWPIARLDSAARETETLAATARHAREVINNQVSHELRDRVAPGDLSGLRQAIVRIREQAKDLRQILERTQPQDRAARARLGGTAGRAWIGFTVGEAERQRRARLDAARADGTAINVRGVHLHAARKLAELGERALEAVAAVASLPPQPDQAAGKLEEQANRLAQALNEVQQWEEREQRQQAAVAATGLADQTRELIDSKRWAGATADAKWGELATEVRGVSRALRRGGDFDRARDLDMQLGTNLQTLHGGDLVNHLNSVATAENQWHGGLDRQTAEQLKRRSDEMGKRPGDARTLDGAVIDLDEARLALAVEGEQRRTKDKDDVGLAFALLAKDIGVVADSGVAPTKKQVDDFAERAAVLAGMRGDRNKEITDAKQKLAAEAAKAENKTDEAQKLDKLAAQAEKAQDKAEARKELTDALAKLAKDKPVDAKAEREEKAELAAELKDLARRDAELAAQEQAARRAFAEAEKQIAKALAQTADEAKQAAATTPDAPLAEALKAAERAAPDAARDAAKLADNATRQAPVPAQTKADAAGQKPDAADQQAKDAGAKSDAAKADNAKADSAKADGAKPDAAQAAAKPDAAGKQPEADAKPDAGAQPEANAAADAQAQTPSAQLVADANALADRLEQQVAKPLAERFQQAGAEGKDPQARKRAADVGRALADAVAAERDAADKLANVLADRAENRGELAAALDKVDGKESAASAAQQQANDLQQQADRAQAAADRAEADTKQAEARADSAAGTPQAQDAANQAKGAEANAAQAEQNAVAAQQKALDAQLAAVQAAQKEGGKAAVDQLAQAAENLAQAEQNSLAAVEQSSPSENPAASSQTAAQAGENLKRASAALEAIAAALPKAANAAAAELGQQAGQPPAGEPGQGAPEAGAQPGEQAQAGQGEPGQGEGKGQGQGEGKGQGEGSPSAEAAAAALAAIEASPNNPGEGLRNAAAVLANAAAQSRLGQSVGQQSQGQGQGQGQGKGQGKGQGQGQSPGQPGGENQGQAKSTGDAGNATGMRRAPPGVDQADWARSRADKRANIKSAGVEQFGEEHQEAIRAYLKRLGEEK